MIFRKLSRSLFTVLVLSTLACSQDASKSFSGSGSGLEGATQYSDFADQKINISSMPASPIYIQTNRQYEKEYKTLLDEVSSVSTKSLLKEFTAVSIHYLNSNKQLIHKSSDLANAVYYKVVMKFKGENQQREFIVDIPQQKLSETKHYFDSPYTLSATCLSKSKPTCSVAGFIVTKFEKQNDIETPIGKVGFMYSTKTVTIDIKRANLHPEQASELVKTIVTASGSNKSNQQTISIAGGTTLSQISISLDDQQEMHINSVISIDIDEDKSTGNKTDVKGEVVLVDKDGKAEKVGEAELTGVDLTSNEDTNLATHQVQSTGDISVELDLNDDEKIQVTTENTDSRLIQEPPAEDQSARIISPDVFIIDLKDIEGSNSYKQTMNFIAYGNDPELDNYLAMFSAKENSGFLSYCQRVNKSKRDISCGVDPNSSECKKFSSSSYKPIQRRNSVQNYLNHAAAWQPYIADVYAKNDVSPLNFATTFVESTYSKKTDYKVDVGYGDGRKNDRELGMFQIREMVVRDIDPKGQMFDVSRFDKDEPWDINDDRAYLVPSVDISSLYQSILYKVFNNKPELMYSGYNMGRGAGPIAVACSSTSDPVACKRANRGNGNSLIRVTKCLLAETNAEKNECFNNLPDSLQSFNPTTTFNNSLKHIRRFELAPCRTIEGTYEILALAKIAIQPDEFGFDVTAVQITDEMRINKSTNP